MNPTENETLPLQQQARLDAIERSGFGQPFRFVQPHNAAFWVFLLITCAGVYGMARYYGPGLEFFAPAIIIGLISFAALTVPFWLFLNYLDRFEPIPVRLRLLAFLWGGVAAVFGMVISANDGLTSIYSKLLGQPFAVDWGPALSAPFTEEIAKGSGFVLLLVLAPLLIRTAYDAAIVGAFIGLGFQILENLLYIFNSAASAFGAEQGQAVIGTLFARIATGVASHTLFSALFCMGLLWLIGRPDEPRRTGLGLALVVAGVGLHGVANGITALTDGSPIGSLFTWLIIPAIALFIFVRALRTASRQERIWMKDIMLPEMEAGEITEPELDALSGTRKDRKSYIKAEKGRKHRKRAHRILSSATDLAARIAADNGQETAAVSSARADVRRARDS